MSLPAAVEVEGIPTGAPTWRQRVAEAVLSRPSALVLQGELALDFRVRARQFVDLDTLVENAAAGLRDAGVLARGLPGLDVVLATKSVATATGLTVTAPAPGTLRRRRPPGTAALDATADRLPGTRPEGKRAWREGLAAVWAGQPPLEGQVWTEVSLAVSGSVLRPVEPILDGLEPVLGRDPRGRAWQEFFPADDRITWLRVQRGGGRGTPLLRLRLGPLRTGRDS